MRGERERVSLREAQRILSKIAMEMQMQTDYLSQFLSRFAKKKMSDIYCITQNANEISYSYVTILEGDFIGK